MTESQEEDGRRKAEEDERLASAAPAIKMVAATHACLIQLVTLLILKKVIEPQDALAAFAQASDEIQMKPGSEVAVQLVENLCRAISTISTAKRSTT